MLKMCFHMLNHVKMKTNVRKWEKVRKWSCTSIMTGRGFEQYTKSTSCFIQTIQNAADHGRINSQRLISHDTVEQHNAHIQIYITSYPAVLCTTQHYHNSNTPYTYIYSAREQLLCKMVFVPQPLNLIFYILIIISVVLYFRGFF